MPQSGQDSRPSRKLSETPIALPSLPVTGPASTDAQISTPSQTETLAQLTLFPAAHRASRRPLLESVEAEQMTDGSGRRCFESFARFFPDGSWQRILLESLLLKTVWRSRLCFLRWKLKDMKSSHRLFIRLQAWAPRTSANVPSLLPTLTASDGGGNRSAYPGAPFRLSLRNMASKGMLPILRASDADTQDAKQVDPPSHRYGKRKTPCLNSQFSDRNGGQLNPEWCEWYMGFPIGWTESKDLETRSRRTRSTPS